jgi:hypothetical protein
LAERIVHPVELIDRQPRSDKIHRRRSCNAPSVSSSLAAVATSSSTDAAITKAEAKTTSTATTSTTSKHIIATTTASTVGGTTSSSTSSNGGHQFTLINKCSSAVKPVVVSTACGYSPRCADASTAAMPSSGSLAAGKTTAITIPNNVC